MTRLFDAPRQVLVILLVLLWLSVQLGAWVKNRSGPLRDDQRNDFNVVLSATLTLLGLIIGFSFSMAVSRYDQRKNYEEAEANAAGTEYLRVELLPVVMSERAKDLLRRYVDQRVLFYEPQYEEHASQVDDNTARLQRELWAVMRSVAAEQPTPIVTLATSGMNDVLNTQADTTAAWRNRIPTEAWILMIGIAMCCCFMIGFTTRYTRTSLVAIIAVVLSVALFLIADIDAPRHGLVQVAPQNLTSLASSMRGRP
jgi:ABC-type uncharacterized transport system fused permease/ATPase subunit